MDLSFTAAFTEDGQRLVRTLCQAHPPYRTVRDLAYDLAVGSSTLISRFWRLGLPSPKAYIDYLRLIRGAEYVVTQGYSIARAAHWLGESSPQSFGRTIQRLTGRTAAQTFRTYTPEWLWDDFLRWGFAEHLERWVVFHPLCPRSLDHVPSGETPTPIMRVA